MVQADSTEKVADYIEQDIINFLTKKYVLDASLSVGELMEWYQVSPDRAKRALDSLTQRKYLRKVDELNYQVII